MRYHCIINSNDDIFPMIIPFIDYHYLLYHYIIPIMSIVPLYDICAYH